MADFRASSFPAANFGRYRLLASDNPWGYRNKKTGGSHTSGSVQHYPTMTLPELHDMTAWVDKVMDPAGSVAFMWATTPMAAEKDKVFTGHFVLPDRTLEEIEVRRAAALSVLLAWGYTYKTKLYWEKTGKLGIGHYFRNQIEECFIGIKGDAKCWRSAMRNVIHERGRAHSQKPEGFYKLLEDEVPYTPRLELFARTPREGWDTGL